MKTYNYFFYIAIIIITHEILFAKKAADYIIFMENGRIVEMGDVDILEKPKTEELKKYLSNVFMA